MTKHARFQAVVVPHLDRLVQLAGRFGEEEAEDYVQETFTRAWVNFDQLADPEAAFPWLCSILFNVASEKRRLQGAPAQTGAD